ncbi:hypothetical protein [Ancylobacter pratisalsi]|uniref:Uncharacterized protein n=1 Tax=Ancylobacter pratisalsi TaxID=1745854 RepID=A0A6P1YGG3_9HYPH|nr:hypothetical protein [Ancylobacter pratisalsi]QIB32398.1 hypothetical protein G3A50_00780 [Ancylobacter pratisalsi]
MVMLWLVALCLCAVAVLTVIGRARSAPAPGGWVGIAAVILLALWLADIGGGTFLRPPSPVLDTLPPSAALEPPQLFGTDAGTSAQSGWGRVAAPI